MDNTRVRKLLHLRELIGQARDDITPPLETNLAKKFLSWSENIEAIDYDAFWEAVNNILIPTQYRCKYSKSLILKLRYTHGGNVFLPLGDIVSVMGLNSNAHASTLIKDALDAVLDSPYLFLLSK